jgi:hypothetical protein
MRHVVAANARQTPIDRTASKPGTTKYAKGDALSMLEKSADEYRTLATRANRMAKRGR